MILRFLRKKGEKREKFAKGAKSLGKRMERMQNEEKAKKAKKEKHTQKSNKAVIAAVVVVAAAVGCLGYHFIQKGKVNDLLAAEGIYQGVTIDGADVSGMSQAEALALLQDQYKTNIEGQILTLSYEKAAAEDAEDTEEPAEQQKWEIPFVEIGAGYDVEGAVKAAYETGRKGTEEENFAVGKELLKGNIDIEVAYTYDDAMLDAKLAEITETFDRDAEDSTVLRKSGRFVISPEKEGLKMDQAKTKQAVAKVMETRKSGKAKIAAEVTEPKITAKDNEHVTDLIGSYYTTFNNSDRNRNNNLVVGCQHIDGTMLAPGEVFSANIELGSQTAAGGYVNAGVYNNGKVEQGMAGGVCQVTSTLYNAAIMAELEIVERHPHSMTVGYVPLGRDAAVAGTYKDLKFKNNTDYPIMIEAYASGGKLVMNIYGHEVHDGSRRVEYPTDYQGTIPKPAEVVKKDPERPEGEREVTARGRTGSKVSVRKVVYQNGKQISNEWFSSSSYRATPDEVTIGTKKPETPPATTPPTDTPAVSSGEGFGIQ